MTMIEILRTPSGPSTEDAKALCVDLPSWPERCW